MVDIRETPTFNPDAVRDWSAESTRYRWFVASVWPNSWVN